MLSAPHPYVDRHLKIDPESKVATIAIIGLKKLIPGAGRSLAGASVAGWLARQPRPHVDDGNRNCCRPVAFAPKISR